MSTAAAARAGFFRSSRFHIGPRSLRSQGVSIEHVKPIFDYGKAPWWTRWTYFLVAADIFVTATACELSWSHWTMWEELPEDQQPASSATSTDKKDVVGHYVLRPWWQRGMFAASSLVLGVGLAGVLLGFRSRIVRRMFIIPDPAAKPAASGDKRLLVIQSPLHSRHTGAVYPLQRTRLVHSSDPTEMMIALKDTRGHYSIPLARAEVGGEKLSLWDSKKALFTTWYGEHKGAHMLLNSAKVSEGGQ